jgi:hypothetical protein
MIWKGRNVGAEFSRTPDKIGFIRPVAGCAHVTVGFCGFSPIILVTD